MQATIIISGLVTGLLGAGATWILIKQEEYRASRERERNPQVTAPPVTPVEPARRELIDTLRHELGRGEALKAAYYEAIRTRRDLSATIREIEQWRTEAGEVLNAPPLRDSGAVEYVLTLGGDRITEPLQRLREVLANLDRWIAQGSSVIIRKGVGELVRLRAEGVSLRNRQIHSQAEWATFHREFDLWDKAVLREMRALGVGEGDIAWFETLDQVPMLQFSQTLNESHAKDLRELSEKLRRLLDIIQRFEQG